uniref:Uncharacterized protein n=1 Tax=Triticum urartu TaxID=4572 RepID=A0A8R7U3B5_TRIUA
GGAQQGGRQGGYVARLGWDGNRHRRSTNLCWAVGLSCPIPTKHQPYDDGRRSWWCCTCRDGHSSCSIAPRHG